MHDAFDLYSQQINPRANKLVYEGKIIGFPSVRNCPPRENIRTNKHLSIVQRGVSRNNKKLTYNYKY